MAESETSLNKTNLSKEQEKEFDTVLSSISDWHISHSNKKTTLTKREVKGPKEVTNDDTPLDSNLQLNEGAGERDKWLTRGDATEAGSYR